MSDKVLVVLTGKTRDQMMSEGGTAHWVLNPAVVRGFKYVVCVRHAHPAYDPGPGARSEPHGAAFLVAEIADLQPSGYENRYRVMFKSVADILVPKFWDGSRNPVRYMQVSYLQAHGIELDQLDFQPMPAIASAPDAIETTFEEVSQVVPLTIADAKRGLAAMFSVPVEAVEITIKG